MRTTIFRFSLFLIIVCIGVSSSFAQTAIPTSPHGSAIKGVLTIRDDFQIFPIGKVGNTIYYKNTKIISKPKLVMHDAIKIFGGVVYYGSYEAGESVMGFEGNPKVSFTTLNGGFYALRTPEKRKKLLRVDPKNKIQVLLPRSNTASGLAYNGADKAAFFHIYNGETVEMKDGRLNYRYTFKIHIVRSDVDELDTLRQMVNDFSPRLKLKWVKKDQLQYQLSNGQKKVITIQ